MRAKAILEELRPDATLEDEIALLGEDDVFEMANLTSRQTGIEGIVFISTNVPKLPHGPRVKYFEKTGKGQPSFSVSIGADPQVVANSLPDRVMRRAAPGVIAWVKLNRADLLHFWNDGEKLTFDELTEFVAGLKKLPASR